MHIEVNGSIKYPIVTMQIDGPHTDIQFFSNGIGYGVIYPEAVPAI